MTPDRIVFDTNVLISGLFSTTSTPALALEKAVSTGQILASTDTLKGLVAKLLSPKFDRYVARENRDALLLRLSPLIEMVEVIQPIRACRDPDDDKFLAVAVNGRAAFIVTGDRDLLDMHPFAGIAIVTPADYLRQPADDNRPGTRSRQQ